MKKNIIRVILKIICAVVFLFPPSLSFALSPNSYPGAVWMLSGRDLRGIDGTHTQGFVRQGIEILPIDSRHYLQVYGRYNWRFRDINKNYYNAYTPYLGTMVSWKYMDAGVEFGWPHYTGIANSNKDYNIFINWFRYWNLKEWSKADFIKAMPLSTWGNLAYDLTSQNGSSTMGWVRLEADLLWLPHDYMAGPFVSYSWRLRDQNSQYFNLSEVATGLQVGNGNIAAGAQYSWSNYPKLGRSEHGLEFYLTIYAPWNLKTKH